MALTFTLQEHLAPGESIAAKWAFAERLGYQGLELRGGAGMRERLPELRMAAQSGVPMQSICVIARAFIGAFDPEQRLEALTIMHELIEVAAAIGANGVITPAAYGLHSNRLPPFEPPRAPADDDAILIDALKTLGEYALGRSVEIWLEPLNRYEDHMVNTLAKGIEVVRAVGLPSVRIMGDLFHMNIEEANSADAIRDAGEFLGHIHLADSQRFEPGTGHTDFGAAFTALSEIGFTGICALECALTGEPETSLSAALTSLCRAEP